MAERIDYSRTSVARTLMAHLPQLLSPLEKSPIAANLG